MPGLTDPTNNSLIPQDPDLERMVNEVEEDLLAFILSDIEKSKLTIGKAQLLAQDFLALLPVTDKKDLLKKLSSLQDTYEEARDVFVKHGGKYETEMRDEVLNKMRDFIKSGDIEKAIEAAKGGA